MSTWRLDGSSKRSETASEEEPANAESAHCQHEGGIICGMALGPERFISANLQYNTTRRGLLSTFVKSIYSLACRDATL